MRYAFFFGFILFLYFYVLYRDYLFHDSYSLSWLLKLFFKLTANFEWFPPIFFSLFILLQLGLKLCDVLIYFCYSLFILYFILGIKRIILLLFIDWDASNFQPSWASIKFITNVIEHDKLLFANFYFSLTFI